MNRENLQKFIYSKCNNPYVIYNKSATYVISRTKHIYANGKVIPISSLEIDSLLHSNKLPPFFRNISEHIKLNHDNILRYSAITEDGTQIPLFYLVPCRHCPYCQYTRSRDMQTRTMCENLTSKTPPLAVLLTYDNDHLPADGVSKKDIDLFMKRLRISLQREGYNDPLRFLLVSEYGSKRGRAHYHAIFWNFPQFSTNKYNNYVKVKRYLEKVWQKGFCFVHFTHDGQSCNTNNATSYYTKYIYKGCVRNNLNEPFIKSSRRPGLGALWLSENEDFYLAHSYTKEIVIRDIWSNTTYKATLPRYFQDKLFPSISRLIPKEIRDAFKILQRVQDEISPELYKELTDKYWFLPTYKLPLLTRDFVKSYGITALISPTNFYHSFKQTIQFTDLDDIVDFIVFVLTRYKIPDSVQEYIFNIKYDFAVEYFSLLDTNKILLENMTPYEYHEYMNNQIKQPNVRFSDEQ